MKLICINKTNLLIINLPLAPSKRGSVWRKDDYEVVNQRQSFLKLLINLIICDFSFYDIY